MKTIYLPKISRRATLQWIAVTSLMAAFPPLTRAGTNTTVAFNPTPKGYGTDPHLNEPVVPWSRTMELHQLQQTAVLADLVLPGLATAPAPSMLGIPEFVDEWVSAPYPEQQRDRPVILGGLKWIDDEAVRRGNRDFLETDDNSRQKIVEDIAQKRAEPAFAALTPFFQRFRFLVVTAYYTTPEGFRDIGYTGNTPLASYPAVTDEELVFLDHALAKLGLSRDTGDRNS